MTQIGHTLTGIALGTLALPRDASRRRVSAYLAVPALLANVPDLPFPGWGHDRYVVSHSLFVNLALVAVLLAAVWAVHRVTRRSSEGPLILAGALAWLSHFLLDALYNHGHGVRIFWPLSTASLALPLPWFSNITEPGITPHALRVAAIETAFFSVPVLLAIAVRRPRHSHRRRDAGTHADRDPAPRRGTPLTPSSPDRPVDGGRGDGHPGKHTGDPDTPCR